MKTFAVLAIAGLAAAAAIPEPSPKPTSVEAGPRVDFVPITRSDKAHHTAKPEPGLHPVAGSADLSERDTDSAAAQALKQPPTKNVPQPGEGKPKNPQKTPNPTPGTVGPPPPGPDPGAIPRSEDSALEARGQPDWVALLTKQPVHAVSTDTFKREFGSQPCLGGATMINAGVTQGYAWAACYNPGTQLFSQADLNVAKCLTNLHYVQKDVCISVVGSSCDNGYVLGNGRIQNLQTDDKSISGAQSVALQAGFQSLLGMSLNTAGQDATYAVDLASQEAGGLNYIGQNAC